MNAARVWPDVHTLAMALRPDRGVVLSSGGLDPLHSGHARYLLAAAALAHTHVVVVNGDGFLLRKKGYVFMPLADRLAVVAAIAGVEHVVAFDDGTQGVGGAIRVLRPDVFAKGGDRRGPADMDPDELAACREAGCEVVYGVGGFDKPQSSSRLVERLKGQA